jgi:hypothetical protein
VTQVHVDLKDGPKLARVGRRPIIRVDWRLPNNETFMNARRHRESSLRDRQEHSSATFSERVRQRLERVYEWVEASGMTLHGAAFTLVWWRKAGFRWVVALVLLVGAPVGGYSRLVYSAVHLIPGWISDFGLAFEAKDWEIHPFALTSVARNVTLRRDERSAPVFTAAEVEFHGSAWTLVRGLFAGGSYSEITVRHGELLLEQSLGGSWNWEELLDAVPAARRDDAMRELYEIAALNFDNFKIVYTEHVPGNSGGGVIQAAQAIVYIDDVNGSILDLTERDRPDARPTRFHFKARSADGIIEVKGNAGLGARGSDHERASGPHVIPASAGASAGQTVQLDGPFFDMSLYLENIGLGAYSQMVPTTRIMPTRGTLRGTIDVGRGQQGVTCRASLAADNLEFAPNPRLVVVKTQYDELQRGLNGFRVSGPFDPCEAPEPGRRPAGDKPVTVSAVLASLNAQSTKRAPPTVRAYAAFDQQQIAGIAASGDLQRLVGSIAGALGAQVAQKAGAQAGQLVRQSIAGSNGSSSRQPEQGNVATRGLKNLGGGLKRLFGGSDKKPPTTTKSGGR